MERRNAPCKGERVSSLPAPPALLMSGASPSVRTKKALEGDGYSVDFCERVIPYSYKKIDLFHFADLIAIGAGKFGVLAVQATGGGGNGRKRCRKILENEHAPVWLRAGNRIQVWEWNKRGAVGKRKLWAPKIWHITLISGEIQATEHSVLHEEEMAK